MNINIKKLSILIFTVFAFAIGFFGSTSPAHAMTCNSATFTGTVDTGTPPTQAWFEYGTDSSTVSNGSGTRTATQTFNTEGSFPIQQYVSGLSENTSYYYRLVVTNNYGTKNLNVINFTTPACNPQGQTPTVNIYANPSSVSSGSSSVLTWSSNNATYCTATNGWSGTQSTSGSFSTGQLYSTTTYGITCYNSSGQQASNSTTVYVNNNNQVPTVSIYANPSSINYGSSGTVTWNSSNASYCTANNGTNNWSGTQSTSGSFSTGALYSTTTYGITCYSSSGQQASSSATIYVNNNNNYQTTSVSIMADQPSLNYGGSTIIRWYPINATYCYGSNGTNGWNMQQSSYNGSFNTGALYSTTTYTISCNGTGNGYNSNGYATNSVTVYVNGQNNYNYNPVIINPAPTSNTLTAVTTQANQLTDSSAQLNSLIGSSGGNAINAWFEWGRTINLGHTTNITAVGSLTSVIHTDTLTGLDSGTTYYYRAVAQSSASSAKGSILSFTTTGEKPATPIVTPTNNATGLVLITSSVNRNQAIIPTLDNTMPHPGDEINYTLNYQNVGTGSVRNLTLQVTLPGEVNYISSTPTTPNIAGNTLLFNLGTLKANSDGMVTVKVQVNNNANPGTNLDFPATLTYTNPSGQIQSVNTTISAQIYGANNGISSLGAFVFGSGFLPSSIVGWLLLIILILVLILLARYLYGKPLFLGKKTTTVIDHHTGTGKKTTTTTIQE